MAAAVLVPQPPFGTPPLAAWRFRLLGQAAAAALAIVGPHLVWIGVADAPGNALESLALLGTTSGTLALLREGRARTATWLFLGGAAAVFTHAVANTSVHGLLFLAMIPPLAGALLGHGAVFAFGAVEAGVFAAAAHAHPDLSFAAASGGYDGSATLLRDYGAVGLVSWVTGLLVARFAEGLGAGLATQHAALRSAYAQLRDAEARATIDRETGLPPRGELHRRLDEELAEAERRGSTLALVLLELDEAASLPSGVRTAVRRAAADALREEVRVYDIVSRYESDVFGVLLPGCDEAGAKAAADRLRRRLRSVPVMARGGVVRVRLASSVGLVEAECGERPAALLARAAAALRSARAEGGDRVAHGIRTALARVA